MEYSAAHNLARAIRDSEEYRTYHGLKDEVMAELAKIDFDALFEEAYASMTTEVKLIFPEYR